ncbi:MAG: ROK family transcriptional regulator [Candidatus Omnitrophica bacterium]|nr:ROK family transcriptional regulator [Candidatus Omnitrophota bacterium]
MKKKNLILKLILEKEPLSRKEIVEKSGIGNITVSKIIKILINEGKIVKDGKIIRGRGRRLSFYRINPDFYHSIIISYDGNKIIGGVTNYGNKIIFKEDKEFSEKDEELFISRMISFIKNLKENSKLDEAKWKNIGISLLGAIDIKTGEVLGLCGWKKWERINLRKILEEEFKKDIFLFDNPDVLARMEFEIRKNENTKNLLYIYLGEGIGLGIILNGKIFYGSSGNCGEIGHIIVEKDGERCYCGNYGCLEKFANISSIIEKIKNGLKEGVHSEIEKIVNGNIEKIKIEDIVECINRRDKLCIEVIENAGKYIGKVSAMLVNIFNPDVIVFGGPLIKAGDFLLSIIKNSILKEALPLLLEDLKIEFSNIDENEGILKGTNLCIADIFKNRIIKGG